MDIWHLTFAAQGRWPLFDGEGARREAVRLLAERAGSCTLLFSLADDHLHDVVACSRERAGRIARGLLLGLRSLASTGIEPAFIRPVRTRGHLQWLVSYLLGQTEKHRLPAHPALWSGACFADLVGARALVELDLQLRAALPRFRRSDAWRSVGLPEQGVAPADPDLVFRLGAHELAAAAAAAVCADPTFTSRKRPTTLARRVTAWLAHEAGLPVYRVPRAIDVSPARVRRLRHEAVDPTTLRAARLQLALADALPRVLEK